MQRSIRFLVIATAASSSVATVSANELWTYYFVANGSRNYFQGCYGDCQYNGVRADLAGTFTILLNWQTGVGKLFSVDDRLVNVAYDRSSILGHELIPAVPSFAAHGLYTPWASPEFVAGTFTYVAGNGRLVSDGHIPLPEGGYRLGTPYDITFSLSNATLSLSLAHLLHGSTTVAAAPAVLSNATIAGEFNNDNRIDARDYVLWRKSGGSQTDYTLWRMFYGNGPSAAAGLAAPEPSSVLLLGTAAVGALRLRRRKSVPHNRA